MSEKRQSSWAAKFLTTIGAQASYGIDMKYVLVAPIWAIPKCLKKEGLSKGAIDLYEINEAFSGSTVAALRELGLDPQKVNVNAAAWPLAIPSAPVGADCW